MMNKVIAQWRGSAPMAVSRDSSQAPQSQFGSFSAPAHHTLEAHIQCDAYTQTESELQEEEELQRRGTNKEVQPLDDEQQSEHNQLQDKIDELQRTIERLQLNAQQLEQAHQQKERQYELEKLELWSTNSGLWMDINQLKAEKTEVSNMNRILQDLYWRNTYPTYGPARGPKRPRTEEASLPQTLPGLTSAPTIGDMSQHELYPPNNPVNGVGQWADNAPFSWNDQNFSPWMNGGFFDSIQINTAELNLDDFVDFDNKTNNLPVAGGGDVGNAAKERDQSSGLTGLFQEDDVV